jgi:hypothetical protein
VSCFVFGGTAHKICILQVKRITITQDQER